MHRFSPLSGAACSWICIALLACQTPKAPHADLLPQAPVQAVPEDSSFQAFALRFSTDSLFQRSRTLFPLPVQQYLIELDRDTVIYLRASDFQQMDLRTVRTDSWEQQIVTDPAGMRTVVEIRGIENGIVVDYIFEKRNGAWMLAAVRDSST